ncbi:MAG: flagellar FliJ family protein [Myxococcota bacterium]
MKKRQHDVRRAALAQAEQQLRAAESEVERLQLQVRRLHEAVISPGGVQAHELRSRAAMMEQARRAIEQATHRVQQHRAHQRRCAEAVRQSAKEVAALERVEARMKREARRADARREQRAQDEAATRGGGISGRFARPRLPGRNTHPESIPATDTSGKTAGR